MEIERENTMNHTSSSKVAPGSPLADTDIQLQLTHEIERLELQVSRLKRHDKHVDERARGMYEELLDSRRKVLSSIQSSNS